MKKYFLYVLLIVFASASASASESSCSTISDLKRQRDTALQQQNYAAYCKALEGLIRAMPAGETRPGKLQCEAGTTDVAAWKKVREDVLVTMKTTYEQQCKR